ncbi:C40 family peptidase [Paracerasibacillus soli]|uniref:NlpC/P60 family protein n=2 Tax=Paracerasibacillus soli TaxID=480284 RepID=A0ABU5CR28_9BACI|nr:NlpC/P60 family protein [Virgibacillus soli]MDY0408831.1 NlpC/P60 family protein [Virgibacillus soli]
MQTELEGMKELIVEQKKENENRQKSLAKKETELTNKAKELKIKDRDLASLETQVKNNIASARTPIVATLSTSKSNQSAKANNNESASPSANPTARANGNAAIAAGYRVLGTPYVWSGKSPGGFDCSGFVSWAYGQAGYSIPSSTSGLAGIGTKVSSSNMQAGDLVFFNTYKTNGHVAIYLGGGQFLGAQSSKGVSVVSMNNPYWKSRFTGHVRRLN